MNPMEPSLTRQVVATLIRHGRQDLALVVAKQKLPPLPSKTAERLREDLIQFPQFKPWEDDQWGHLANHVRKHGDTRVVFTGALTGLLSHGYRTGRTLPATRDFMTRKVPNASYSMKTQYHDRYMDWLEDAEILIKTTVSAVEALKANHTRRDDKVAAQDPKAKVDVYFPGQTLKGVVELLKRYNAPITL